MFELIDFALTPILSSHTLPTGNWWNGSPLDIFCVCVCGSGHSVRMFDGMPVTGMRHSQNEKWYFILLNCDDRWHCKFHFGLLTIAKKKNAETSNQFLKHKTEYAQRVVHQIPTNKSNGHTSHIFANKRFNNYPHRIKKAKGKQHDRNEYEFCAAEGWMSRFTCERV